MADQQDMMSFSTEADLAAAQNWQALCNGHIGGWYGKCYKTYSESKIDADNHDRDSHNGDRWAVVVKRSCTIDSPDTASYAQPLRAMPKLSNSYHYRFSAEMISNTDSDEVVTVRLCTGTVVDIPCSIIKRVRGPVRASSQDKSVLFLGIELDDRTPEGALACQLATEIDSLVRALDRVSSKINESEGTQSSPNLVLTSTTNFAAVNANLTTSGEQKVYLYGDACKAGGNRTLVYFNNPISRYSLGPIGNDSGVFILVHRQLNATTIEIVHDRTAQCGTSYRGDLILYYDE